MHEDGFGHGPAGAIGDLNVAVLAAEDRNRELGAQAEPRSGWVDDHDLAAGVEQAFYQPLRGEALAGAGAAEHADVGVQRRVGDGEGFGHAANISIWSGSGVEQSVERAPRERRSQRDNPVST